MDQTTYDDTCLRCGRPILWLTLSDRAARIQGRRRTWVSRTMSNLQTEACWIRGERRERHVPTSDSGEVLAWLTE